MEKKTTTIRYLRVLNTIWQLINKKRTVNGLDGRWSFCCSTDGLWRRADRWLSLPGLPSSIQQECRLIIKISVRGHWVDECVCLLGANIRGRGEKTKTHTYKEKPEGAKIECTKKWNQVADSSALKESISISHCFVSLPLFWIVRLLLKKKTLINKLLLYEKAADL